MSTQERSRRIGRVTWAVAMLGTIGVMAGEAQEARGAVTIPQNATALEGVPDVRIDTTRDTATRRELTPAEAAKNRLRIRIADGRFYWDKDGDSPLSVSSAGEFIYLTSKEPGRYVRFRRLTTHSHTSSTSTWRLGA